MNLSKLLMLWALNGYRIKTSVITKVAVDVDVVKADIFVNDGVNAKPTATVIYVTNYQPRMIRADVFLGCELAIIPNANISQLNEWVK